MSTVENKNTSTTITNPPPSKEILIAIAKSLIPQVLGVRAGKAANSVIEIVSIICSVVEAVSAQQQAKTGSSIKGPVKSELAISIAHMVLDALYNGSPQLITQALYIKAQTIINDVNALTPLIDAVVAIANDANTLAFIKS